MPRHNFAPTDKQRFGPPYSSGFAVTPHDTNELREMARAIFVGGAGALKVRSLDGETVAFAVVPAGTTIQIMCDLVYDTDTDATGIVALV